jgi:hypothetical protein
VQGGDGGEELGPWTTWSERVLYRAYELPPLLLRDGANAVGVRLGQGQWRSKWARAWHKQGTPPYLSRLQLHLSLRNGSAAVIAPAVGAWRTTAGPVTSNDVYAGEAHDARLEQPGWDAPGFANASRWDAAADGGAQAVTSPALLWAWRPSCAHSSYGRRPRCSARCARTCSRRSARWGGARPFRCRRRRLASTSSTLASTARAGARCTAWSARRATR